MAYSCAILPQADSSLHEASVAKFDRICQKLTLTADDHVLEVGTGWAVLPFMPREKYGCRVTTTTISRKQYEYSRQQVAAADLANLEQVRGLGFSEEFIRTWEFYFCYCEGAFRERAIGDVQMLLGSPQ